MTEPNNNDSSIHAPEWNEITSEEFDLVTISETEVSEG
jgi:hypothetical protein